MNTGTSFLHRELRALREAEVRKRLEQLRGKFNQVENLVWCLEGNAGPLRYPSPRWERALRDGTLERTRARMDRLRLEIEALEASLRRGIRVDVPGFSLGGGQ
jgi:hypothetical protein